MEERADGGKKVRRIFTPEQKFEILKDIKGCETIKEGLAKHELAHRCITNGSGSWKLGYGPRCAIAGR
jgi:hypothetical protein